MIPSIDACFKFMDTYHMPPHIRAHSIMVEKIATLLAEALEKAGVSLSLEKVRAGALLHDIAKRLCLETGEDHSVKGREICLLNSLDEIAEIVAEHVILKDYRPGGPITEKEIVYYSDKRVNHDTVVSLEKRLQYLLERYGQEKEHLNQAIMRNFERCKELERRIFTRLAFEPGELAGMIQTQ
ncbi:MAG: HD domain-containing protein [Deltaproteobacteria bacterium]|nr:HD domain-containing protein [Deltaproteobacteria bacterium]